MKNIFKKSNRMKSTSSKSIWIKNCLKARMLNSKNSKRSSKTIRVNLEVKRLSLRTLRNPTKNIKENAKRPFRIWFKLSNKDRMLDKDLSRQSRRAKNSNKEQMKLYPKFKS